MVTNPHPNVLISLRDTQNLKKFLQKQNLDTKTNFLDIFRLVTGSGLATAEGDVWRRHREIISNSFHYEFLKTNFPMIQETTREFLESLKPEDPKAYNESKASMVGQTIPALPLAVKVMEMSFFSKNQRLMKRITEFRQICYERIVTRKAEKDTMPS